MTDIQVEILKIFREFKRICDKFNLRYFAIGGTCIGAIRHNGFIPWDDDLDVAMPWDDYTKFRNIAPTELNAPFELYDYKDYKQCELRFLKLHNEKTAFIEEAHKRNYDRFTGVFMDIMPIVGFPDNEALQSRLVRKCAWYHKLDVACRFDIKNKPTFKSKVFSIIVRPLTAGKPYDYFSLIYENLVEKNKFGETKNVLIVWNFPNKNYRGIYPYELFSESIEVPFESTTIRVPKGYDTYLKMEFGNYMELPPENERYGSHVASVIDFNKSYKEYQNKSVD